jgi:hypothetical protein
MLGQVMWGRLELTDKRAKCKFLEPHASCGTYALDGVLLTAFLTEYHPGGQILPSCGYYFLWSGYEWPRWWLEVLKDKYFWIR